MSRQLPEPGTYLARRSAHMQIDPKAMEEGAALTIIIPYSLLGVGYSDRHYLVLGKKDGTLMKRNIDVLRKCFPEWTSDNPFDLEQIPLQGEPAEGEDYRPEFQLQDCFHDDSYTKEGEEQPTIRFKAQWFNPPDGGDGGLPAPATDEEKKGILSRWGTKFKAIGNMSKPAQSKAAAPAQKPAAQKSSAPAAKPAAGIPPGRRAGSGTSVTPRTATQEEVWKAIVKAHPAAENPGEEQDKWGQAFYDAQDKVAPGKNGNLNPQEWGKVLDEMGLSLGLDRN